MNDSRQEKSFSAAMVERRATRHFSSDPVPEPDLRKILAAGLAAPSGYNLQPWRFIVVRDAEQRKHLREAAMGQPKVGEAPVVMVACGDPVGWKNGDLEEVLRLAEEHGSSLEQRESVRRNVTSLLGDTPGQHGGIYPDMAVWVNRQVMIAFTTMMWMAETLGYDTAPMEGFREDKVKAALGIPEHVRVVALLAIGRRKDADKAFAGRFAMGRTVFAERWGKPIELPGEDQ